LTSLISLVLFVTPANISNIGLDAGTQLWCHPGLPLQHRPALHRFLEWHRRAIDRHVGEVHLHCTLHFESLHEYTITVTVYVSFYTSLFSIGIATDMELLQLF